MIVTSLTRTFSTPTPICFKSSTKYLDFDGFSQSCIAENKILARHFQMPFDGNSIYKFSSCFGNSQNSGFFGVFRPQFLRFKSHFFHFARFDDVFFDKIPNFANRRVQIGKTNSQIVISFLPVRFSQKHLKTGQFAEILFRRI